VALGMIHGHTMLLYTA